MVIAEKMKGVGLVASSTYCPDLHLGYMLHEIRKSQTTMGRDGQEPELPDEEEKQDEAKRAPAP
jgi:hypothetical protein